MTSGDNGRAVATDERDRRWMRVALDLARRGRGSTRPNPMVGAVVVSGGQRLGEGFHRRAGGPHAEINALVGLSTRATGATMYVTLEPCCHTGRTAPCTAALIAAKIARVVVGVRDPNPLVNGRGIALLRRAGIRVDVACLEDECRELNRPFFMWVRHGRPLVTLKAAITLDGFMADRAPRAAGARVWITGPAARAAAHVLRSEHDAILVGAGTVLADDPLLTVRVGAAKIPRAAKTAKSEAAPPFLRVILDGKLRVPKTAAVLPPAPGARTLVVGAVGAPASRAGALRRAGAEVVLLPARNGRLDPGRVLGELASRGIQSLLVEGGSEVHAAFIHMGLVDRIAFFYAPRLLGGGVPVARSPAGATMGRPIARALALERMTVRQLGRDLLIQADVRPRRR